MALQIAGQSYKTGAPGQAFPQDQQNGLLVTELNARYYQNVYAGNVFLASGQALILTAAGLSLKSSTGLNLYNPVGSGKNLVLLEVIADYALPVAVAQANYTIWLAACLSPTQAAPISVGAATSRNALLSGGAAAVGVAYTQATLPTVPVVVRSLGSICMLTGGTTVASMGFIVNSYLKDEVAGAIVIPPGIAVAVQTSAAMSVCASMTWAELPV